MENWVQAIKCLDEALAAMKKIRHGAAYHKISEFERCSAALREKIIDSIARQVARPTLNELIGEVDQTKAWA